MRAHIVCIAAWTVQAVPRGLVAGALRKAAVATSPHRTMVWQANSGHIDAGIAVEGRRSSAHTLIYPLHH